MGTAVIERGRQNDMTKRWGHRFSCGRAVITCFLCLLAVAALVGCGGGDGGGEEGSGGALLAAEDLAEVGKAVESGGWQVELTGLSEKINMIGHDEIVYQALEGVFLVVPVTLTNVSADMDVPPVNLFVVQDAQGGEYKPTGSTIQIAYVLIKSGDIVMDTPMAAGDKRVGYVVYDIPLEAEGLSLRVGDATETIALGF